MALKAKVLPSINRAGHLGMKSEDGMLTEEITKGIFPRGE